MSGRDVSNQREHSQGTADHQEPGSWIEGCWDDMRKRSAAGEPFDAGAYLSQLPAPTLDQSVDLLYGEYWVRRDSGESVDVEVLFGRYPAECLAALRRQLKLDEAMGELDAQEVVSSADTPRSLPPQTAACDSEALPLHIGRYTIVARLVGGAQATVFRAYDPQLKRDVLIKMEPPGETGVHNRLSHAEAVISAQLDHPHLALALDTGTQQGRRYVVSRFIEGKSFEQWVRSEKPREHEVAAVVAIAARALADAHRAGILHLDIKPDNIVIDRQRQPHVIDFGLAVLQRLHQPCSDADGMIRGTLPFMSPEQARGESQAFCNATDVFGLAATMFVGLVGQPPYDDRAIAGIEDIRAGRWRQDLLAAAPLSHKMKAILMRALAADPAERFHAMEQFADELEQVASNRGQRVHRRHILQASLAITVGLSAAASPWLWLHQVPSAEEPTLRVFVTSEQGDFVPLAQRGPLQTGDAIRITGQLRHSAAAVLFAMAPRSDVKILQKFPPSRSRRTFSFPENFANALPLTGETGTEIIGLAHGKDAERIEQGLRAFASRRQGQPLPATASITHGTPAHLASHLVAPKPSADYPLAFASQQLAGHSRDLGDEVTTNSGDSLAGILHALAEHLPLGPRDLEVVVFPHMPREAAPSDLRRPAD